MVRIAECFGGYVLAENQEDRGTFSKCWPSQVGMIWRVLALGTLLHYIFIYMNIEGWKFVSITIPKGPGWLYGFCPAFAELSQS